MNDSWQCAPSLSAEQRLDVLNLLNRTEVALGREALDEGRRRIVVHGWLGEHWLKYNGAALAGYAVGADRAVICVHRGSGHREWLEGEIAQRGGDPLRWEIVEVPRREASGGITDRGDQ